MQDGARSLIRGILLFLEIVGVLYVALLCWLLSVWMVDDSWAFRATPADWWRTGALRLGQGVLVAVVAACILLLLNNLLVRFGLGPAKVRPRQIAWLALGIILAATFAGTIQFVLEKPYM